MTDCRDLEPLLTAYVDGQSAAGDRTRIDAHVEACDCCRRQLAAQRAACEALRARRAQLRGCASESLKSRCASLVPERAAAGAPAVRERLARTFGARRWVPMTAAATILFALATVFGLGLNDKVQALALQATIDHAACSRFNLGSSVADPVAAAQRWQARFGWPIKVPGSTGSADDLELRTVRRCAVTDGQVAHILYVWNGEPLSVYVLPRAVVERSPAFVSRFGHEAVMWSQNDRTYMVVSNRRHDASLDRVVAYVRANAY